ncbi:MAG: M15 family metallopeptidase [Desulfobacteraceae bacterium]
MLCSGDSNRSRWRAVPVWLVLCLFLPPSFVDSAEKNAIESRFLRAGLVNVQGIDPTIQVDLVNSDPRKNYFRKNFYGGLNTAYLQKEVALKLSRAQKRLRSKHAGYALLILDAARPRSVSRRMYDQMKGTRYERFVANPEKGSMHNFGVAVDITVVDDAGRELDMGFSPFRKGTFELYWLFAKKKLGIKLTDRQKKNRRLLADTMVAAGFIPLSFEWWHFNGLPKPEARKRYRIIE